MQCKQINKLLPLLVGDELTGKEQRLVRQHLAECESCSREYEKLKAAVSLFSESLQAKSTDISDELWEGFLSQIQEPIIRPSRKLFPIEFGYLLLQTQKLLMARKRRFALAVAGIAVAVSIALLLLLRQSPLPPQTAPPDQQITDQNAEQIPIVERVNKPNVTVLTFETSNPHIKIVWFFDEDLKI